MCPFHSETKPSFTVNRNTKEWFCHGCGEGGAEKEFIAKMYDVDIAIAKYAVDVWYRKGQLVFPNSLDVEKCHKELLNRPSEIAVLKTFGFTDEGIITHQIGWEDTRIVFPIFSRTGYCVNLRKYLPPHRRIDGANNAKVVSVKNLGKGGPRFYPYSAFNQSTIVIVEGEKDCIAARSQGINAVTGTGGSTLPVNEMRMFQDKEVLIMTDTDATGNKIAREYYYLLQPIAKSIKRIMLPAKDFVEYYQQCMATSVTLDIAQFMDKPIIVEELTEAQEVSLINSESVDNLDTWVVLNNMTIVGVEPKIYTVPSKLECICTNHKCDKLCPLAPTSLKGCGPVIDVPPRYLLHFIDSGDSTQDKFVQQKFHCNKARAKPKEHTNAQKIIFQESASFIDGLEESSFEHRFGVFLYPDYRLQATMKYNLTSCRVTDPRSQMVYYVIKEAECLGNQPLVLNPVTLQKFQQVANNCENAEQLIEAHYKEWLPMLAIEGRSDLFGAMILTYCSVTEISWQGGLIKGWLDCITMGDTRTGKSQMAQRFVKNLGLGGYINGENARRTGVIGGIQRFGDSWVVTWGAIPLNDRGLLVIDEASGLDIDDVKDLSSTRSSGAVTLNKIVKGEARARTRLLWFSNPRSGTNLNDFYWKGYGAFQEFIPVIEDQARFDLVLSAAREDIDVLNGIDVFTKPNIEAWQQLIKFAWSVPPESIQYDDQFKEEVRNNAKELNDILGGGPLIVGVAVHEKLLRLSCAFAVLSGSIDSNYSLILRSQHLKYAVEFITRCLSKNTLGYTDYIHELRRAREARAKNVDFVKALITTHPAIRAILTAKTFRGFQFSEVLGIDKSDAAKILSELISRGLVKVMSQAVYKPDSLLVDIARQMGGFSDG